MKYRRSIVTGGYAQGKLDYVCAGMHEAYMVFEGCLPSEAEANRCVAEGITIVIHNLQQYIVRVNTSLEEQEIWEQINQLWKVKTPLVIICNEIGNGIVPVEAQDRSDRELTGRIMTDLASRADEVVRVICGIGQKLK